MQDKLPDLVPLTDLRRRAGDVIDKLPEEPRVTIVTSNGAPVAVLFSWAAWKRAQVEAKQ